ncbi:MAG: hypothetical protein JOZ18_15640 [Chloroflexi bacterium]|nr:hypothetical protein [Chloroflexota bacterium]
MSEAEYLKTEPGEDDLEVKITDLEARAAEDSRNEIALVAATRFLDRQFSAKRRPARLAVTCVVVLSVLLLLLSSNGNLSWLIANSLIPSASYSSARAKLSPLLSTFPVVQQDGLTCLTSAAWSPDSKYIAVLGYSQDCPQVHYRYQSGLLNLYDAHSAKLIAQVRPDAIIFAALSKQFTQSQAAPIVLYNSVVWSPDGQQIALTFFADFLPDQTAPTFAGIFLLGEHGEHKVFLWRERRTDSFPSYLSWDLQRGVPTVVTYEHETYPLPLGTVNIDPALAYRWGANGALIPEMQASGADPLISSCVPVGNSDGGASFTLWQPGWAARTSTSNNGSIHVPGLYTWNTLFTAWSPDGRYLANEVFTGGRFAPPGLVSPGHQILVDFGMDQLLTLKVRDPALTDVLNQLPQSYGGSSDVAVAWRPDGHILAIYDNSSVDLYDCATGEKLASLIPHDGIPADLGGTDDILRWSPDGSHLLLSSTNWGPLSLWGPGQLPK